MELSRRTFIATSLAAAGGTSLAQAQNASVNASDATSRRPLIVSTWPFGRAGNEQALKVIGEDGSTLDAVEQGIRLVEASGNSSVGLSGRPNAAGFVQLDACIMHGPGQQAGSVAAMEGIVHPITAARRVMEKTRHVMLAGEGARWFALEQGLESVDVADHPDKKRAWNERRREDGDSQPASDAEPSCNAAQEDDLPDSHDTITMLVLGADGTISGGCSTSGLAGKLPGRVGDSPILGSGLYVDNEVGAAGATGVGENVMRYCASFLVVELMRQGLSPTEACRQTLARIARVDPLGKKLDIHFVALDKKGRYGAAGSGDFPYSVTYPGFSRVLKA